MIRGAFKRNIIVIILSNTFVTFVAVEKRINLPINHRRIFDYREFKFSEISVRQPSVNLVNVQRGKSTSEQLNMRHVEEYCWHWKQVFRANFSQRFRHSCIRASRFLVLSSEPRRMTTSEKERQRDCGDYPELFQTYSPAVIVSLALCGFVI